MPQLCNIRLLARSVFELQLAVYACSRTGDGADCCARAQRRDKQGPENDLPVREVLGSGCRPVPTSAVLASVVALGSAAPLSRLPAAHPGYFRLALGIHSFSLTSLSFIMLSSSGSRTLGLLYLLSLGLAGTDARAAPHPEAAPVSSPGKHINLMRRTPTKRSDEDPAEWLQRNRLATRAKYGVGGEQKRSSGMNLYVPCSRRLTLCLTALYSSGSQTWPTTLRTCCSCPSRPLSLHLVTDILGALQLEHPQPRSMSSSIQDLRKSHNYYSPKLSQHCLGRDLWLASDESATSRSSSGITLFDSTCE